LPNNTDLSGGGVAVTRTPASTRSVTIPGVGPEAHHRLAAHRTADIVAEELRRRIIEGELGDGAVLPSQRRIAEQLSVSLVSVGAAMRILESESLVSVRRGKRGGAVVHAPAKTQPAYMFGMMLQNDSATMTDLREALQALEPACAGFAALRPDRGTTLLPELVELNHAMTENLDDGPQFAEIGRQFHHRVARGCGNKTMIAVLDSLETLWVSQELEYLDHVRAEGAYPTPAKRRAAHDAHVRITSAIAEGDANTARRLTYQHVGEVHRDSLPDDTDVPIRVLPRKAFAGLGRRP
jgi:GntR family transcriptional regulator, transcriptional repressor for pyruvate dehydrogenase complex